jgi:hypothetical protein
MNLVTPKARAKHELLFNKPASDEFLSAVSDLGKVIYICDTHIGT